MSELSSSSSQKSLEPMSEGCCDSTFSIVVILSFLIVVIVVLLLLLVKVVISYHKPIPKKKKFVVKKSNKSKSSPVFVSSPEVTEQVIESNDKSSEHPLRQLSDTFEVKTDPDYSQPLALDKSRMSDDSITRLGKPTELTIVRSDDV